MLTLQRRSEPLLGRDSYFQDQWDYFRADLRAKGNQGLTDMELVGVDDDGDFCSIKVSVSFFLSNRNRVTGLSIDSVCRRKLICHVIRQQISVFFLGR